jgi:hypothetical protein
MIDNQASSQPERAPVVDVRVCDRCGRPLPALNKDEYTPARALLVARTGFCLCPTDGPDAVAPVPDHAPAVI